MKNTPRQQLTLSEIRAKAGAIGYKIQCRTFSTDSRYAVVQFINPSTQKAVVGNVYPAAFVAQHKAIFEYLNSIKGAEMTDRQQFVLIPN